MNDLSVLVIDDEKRIIDELSEYLESGGYTVYSADRPSVALETASCRHIDVALVDIKLPEYSGLELIKRLKNTLSGIEIIVMSGHGDMDSVIEAFRLGAFDYLKKPFSVFELQAAIGRTRRFVEAQSGARRYAHLCSQLNRELAGDNTLIGTSSQMERLRSDIMLAGTNSSSPVLITGESGTGKELVARQIHLSGSRSSHRFMAVNCAAIPRDMFESEFFGHEKGAFTDAHGSRDGFFRSADGGTLFLDEVAEIPFELQAKLLRTIENGQVRPVGADREHPVDVRIICATNRDLATCVTEGSFRADLYWRLAVLPITVVPLRERRSDIPLLAAYFLSRFLEGKQRSPAVLSDHVLSALSAYDFPGNIRELRNLMERAAIHSRSDGTSIIDYIPGFVSSFSMSPPVECSAESLNLEHIEKNTIVKALMCSRGVRSRAASLLGLTRQALDRRLERFSLNSEDFR